MTVFLGGCGSGNSGNSGNFSDSVSAGSSQVCIDCHSSVLSPVVVTAKIVDEWKISNHNTARSGAQYGSGCADCHEPQTGHPNYCGRCHGGTPTAYNVIGYDVVRNPDDEKKCYKCHHAGTLSTGHFTNITSGASFPASFVSKNYENRCRACHNPHDVTTLLPINKDWAASGHGNVNAKPWTEQDFKNNTACIRCHTATGYINFITGAAGAFPEKSWATPGDKTREVLTCAACHLSYDFKNSIRDVPAFVAPYNNGASPKTFPDIGASNLCAACHSGRESADTIEAIKDFTNVSFKNSHYKAGAGLMYMAVGFYNFTTLSTKVGSTTYKLSLTPDNITVPTFGIAGGVSSTHRKLGTTLINGDTHKASFFVPGVADANGPCVTCHMNANGQPHRGGSHSYKISSAAFEQLCSNCHGSEGDVKLTGANFQQVFLEPQHEVFAEALKLITNLLLTRHNIKYDGNTYPYFYDMKKDPAGKTAVTDWTRGTKNQVFGKRLMGACYNLNLVTKDPGAYAHARTFVRRLIYDSIDFLDNGKQDFSVGTTAIAYDKTIYSKGTAAYTDNTLTKLAPGTTESMTYLIGWSRTTGGWNTPERP